MNITGTEMITFDQLLDVVFAGDRLRLAASNGNEVVCWRPPASGQWTELRAYARGEPPSGPERFLADHGGMDVTFSPWPAAGWGPTSALVGALWAGIRVPTTPPRANSQFRGGVSPEGAAAVRARLMGTDVPPTVLVNEGWRMVAFWRVDTPLPESSQGNYIRLLLHRLGLRVDGDPDLADPATALVGIPGSTSTATLPRTLVTVDLWEPSRVYSVKVIERWLAAPASPNRVHAEEGSER